MGRNIIRGALVRKQVIDILNSGGSIAEAASVTGFTPNYVRQLGVKNGIRFPRPKIYHTDRSKKNKRIADLYAQGYSSKEIVDLLGYKSVTTVHVALRESHVPIRKKKHRVNTVQIEFRTCDECNALFFCSEHSNQRFCSSSCQRSAGHRRNDSIRRARKYNALIDRDITLEAVAEKDNDICYLCGEKVDWFDYKIIGGKKCALGDYPSIDHVLALSKGGNHSWDNVRLAHCKCNASKGVDAVG